MRVDGKTCKPRIQEKIVKVKNIRKRKEKKKQSEIFNAVPP